MPVDDRSTDRPRLVITADDGGAHPRVDAGILAAAEGGCVTGVSVLATGPSAGPFVAQALERGLGVGLHLDLTDGPPLSPGGRHLARGGAAFSGDKRAVWRAAAAGRLAPGAVAEEAAAQAERLRRWGATLDHADSHNHVHGYGAVLVGLLAGVSAPAGAFLRVPWEPESPPRYRPAFPPPLLPAPEIARRAGAAGWRTPDRFVGLRFSAEPGWAAVARLAGARPGVTEWMVHPGGRPDTPFGRDPRRAAEAALLRASELPGRLAAWGYVLARFGDLS